MVVTAPHIEQEKYWKSCCEREKKNYQTIKLEDHGLSWKVAYLEKYVERVLEETENYLSESRDDILKIIKVINPWIFSLEVKIIAPDLNIEEICKYLLTDSATSPI